MITIKAISLITHTIEGLKKDLETYPCNKDLQKAMHELKLKKSKLINRYRFFN